MNTQLKKTVTIKLSMILLALILVNNILNGQNKFSSKEIQDPVQCYYAPSGEYIKDHSLIYQDDWWHLFSISGIEGYYHGYNGNEETVSWSISKDLINWEMRGHIIHASQRKDAFDQHEVWAPFCLKANNKFFMFYTGVIHPHRPLTYEKPGSDHIWVYEGHKETQGLAVSEDLTSWVKTCDVKRGLGIPGRDSHVVWNEDDKEWLLYTTGPTNRDGLSQAFVSRSKDLFNWNFWGVCALFPTPASSAESLCVMKHPLNNKWIILGNYYYAISDNPLSFLNSEVKEYNYEYNGEQVEIGSAGEMIEFNGKWYRSGFYGELNKTKLCFTEIQWIEDGAFKVLKPSIINDIEKED